MSARAGADADVEVVPVGQKTLSGEGNWGGFLRRPQKEVGILQVTVLGDL